MSAPAIDPDKLAAEMVELGFIHGDAGEMGDPLDGRAIDGHGTFQLKGLWRL